MGESNGRAFTLPDPERDQLTAQAMDHLRALVKNSGYGVEARYFGCATQQRADDWRRAYRRAGKKLGVAVWTVWHYCGDGPDCGDGHKFCEAARDPVHSWHVHFRAHDPADAQKFMAAKAKAFGWPQRPGDSS